MESLAWKMRIAVLWVFIAVALSGHEILYVWEPGAIQKVMSGEMAMGPDLSLLETLSNWLVPMVMAFLSVTLADSANRWLNLVMGAIYSLLSIVHLVTCPIVHLTQPSAHQLLFVGSTVVVSALIWWHARKWPEPRA